MPYPTTIDAGVLPSEAATIFIAASNASTKSQSRADYVCNGSTDQTTIATAVSALPANGGQILFSEGDFYTSSAYLIVSSTISFLGMGRATVFHSTSTGSCFQSSSTAFSDIVFDNITFNGPVNQTVSTPTRARTTSGNGIDRAIRIDGSLDTSGSAQPLITNITIRNCNFRNCTWTPISIFGVTGKVLVHGNEFYNNMDPGFGFNANVQFNNNFITMSADNGVSISRGNAKVTCHGNTFENICQDGIWISGFTGTEAPTYFSIVGNVIKNVGNNGINGKEAPKYGVIANNEITQGYNRGASDQHDDYACSGISIVGYPSASAPSFTDNATGISIAGNHIYQCPRLGIYYDGVIALDIKNNLICDTGTQYMYDGVTAITSTNTAQNIGILAGHTTTLTNVQIQNNTIVDSRATPYCNYAVYPQSNPNINLSGNVMAGCRNASNVTPTANNGIFGQGSDGAVTLDGTATVSWASKSGNIYTLNRDVYCTDLTITSVASVVPNGNIINCSGTLTNNGVISSSGNNAVGATLGGGASGNGLRGGGGGIAGGTGVGTVGTTVGSALGGNGGAGGASGATAGGNGGTATAPASYNGGSLSPQKLPFATIGSFVNGASVVQGWAGGAGGGAGAGDGTNAGGGSGGGGGVLIVTARYIVLASGAFFKAFGGNGGNAAGGNAAGGGGGGGGLCILNTTSFTGTTPTNANTCTGGTAGTSSGTGTAATVGANGTVFLNIFS